jgi:hypothetical protein
LFFHGNLRGKSLFFIITSTDDHNAGS